MKVKVIKRFRDKNTKEIYEAGRELEVSRKRLNEMNSTKNGKFVVELKEEKKQEKKPAKK